MRLNRSDEEAKDHDHGANSSPFSGMQIPTPTAHNADGNPLRVLSVASEAFPLIKTGGLADVTGSLPQYMSAWGIETKTLLPAYPGILEKCTNVELVSQKTVLGQDISLFEAHYETLNLLLLDCPALYDRPGGPYLDHHGRDHHDNWLRFAVLSCAAAQIAAEGIRNWKPALVHLHDWQAALTACYMRAAQTPVPVVLTIHNLAFQGQFPADIFYNLDLPAGFLSTDILEYYHDISYLKAGIQLADAIIAVSPTYAREILTQNGGMGMAGVLQGRRAALSGILNGIDSSRWNPVTDSLIHRNYDLHSLHHRTLNRAMIERQFGLRSDDGPVVSVISRLTWQKGIDMLASVLPVFIDHGAKLVVLGDGDAGVVYPLLQHLHHHPGSVAVQIGYSEEVAHVLHAGSDIVLQPSRFEPCGLTQLYALRYGAVPIVARTGGLAETVIDANEAAMVAGSATGFQFHPGSPHDLHHALERAFMAYRSADTWRQLQSQGMRADFSWQRSASQYAQLYHSLTKTISSPFEHPH